MTCDELRPDYTSWALGVADDPERAEIDQHLARRCAVCMAGVTSAMATVTALSGAVPVKEPPKDLRRRVIGLVQKAPVRSWPSVFLPWAITAAVSIALIAIGVSGRRQSGDTPRLQQALLILNDPATRDVAFGQTRKTTKGRVFVNSGKGILFIGAEMPRLDDGKTFELWVVPANGKPAPAGLFQSEADATALFVKLGAVENAAEIAVTVEPEGGSPQPTGEFFIVTKL